MDNTIDINIVLLEFDERSTNWSNDPDMNRIFIENMKRLASDRIRIQGMVTLHWLVRFLDVTCDMQDMDLYVIDDPRNIQIYDEGNCIALFVKLTRFMDWARD